MDSNEIIKKCPKCDGEGFIIVEDVEILAVKECSKCKGEGVIE
jgi:DnaJ-class molecular chaperone